MHIMYPEILKQTIEFAKNNLTYLELSSFHEARKYIDIHAQIDLELIHDNILYICSWDRFDTIDEMKNERLSLCHIHLEMVQTLQKVDMDESLSAYLGALALILSVLSAFAFSLAK